jgi:hypothetical protein
LQNLPNGRFIIDILSIKPITSLDILKMKYPLFTIVSLKS